MEEHSSISPGYEGEMFARYLWKSDQKGVDTKHLQTAAQSEINSRNSILRTEPAGTLSIQAFPHCKIPPKPLPRAKSLGKPPSRTLRNPHGFVLPALKHKIQQNKDEV